MTVNTPAARRSLLHRYDLPLSLGAASMCLGSVGLLVCFLPILGIPLSLAGLVVGLIAFVMSLSSDGPAGLRSAAAGIVICCSSLAMDLAINYAPSGYLPSTPHQDVPRLWHAVPDRPYAPPPARPGFPGGGQARAARSAYGSRT